MSAPAAYPAPWSQNKAAMQGIFERRWYTSHGPAAQGLERRLGALLNVSEAIVATNPAIGLLMVMEALSVTGDVLLPGLAPPRCVQALRMTGLNPVFCDVDPGTGQMTAATALAAITPRTAAILGVSRWGGACDVAGLSVLAAERGLPLVFDSGEGFGCHVAGVPLGGHGGAELFAFDAASIVDGAGGACLTTNDPVLAARMRNIRSSYGAGSPVKVVRTANGRFSEAQAVLAALGLDNYAANLAHNKALHGAYSQGLAGVPTASMLPPAGVTASNHQAALCRITFAADFGRVLLGLQAASGGVRRLVSSSPPGLPGVDAFLRHVIMLPMGNAIEIAMVHRLCDLLRAAS